MERFYFHVRDGAELITDVEGVELKDASEAKRMPCAPPVSFWRNPSRAAQA
jgi:uncharacterized protein DUF6894